ncbi:DNA primase DnaG [Peptoclostridium acidaminophilum DSM 3953]|uniref:DNA primase n=2 Tax=Peptoclostridium acidaminophilum TaxID=1731 RepID=W8U724_PEPAC|nr:DNA primase DnaG [Peptoclostridium acidaminophilum DSM 3953]
MMGFYNARSIACLEMVGMNYFAEDFIDEIKEKSDIVQIVSEYVDLHRAGTNFKARCPFHGEKTPSFIVSPSKQMYKCFGCGEGGDVIKFVMKMENVEFKEALEILAKKAGIEIVREIDPEMNEKINQRKRYEHINVEAARYFFKLLWTGKNQAQEYLSKRGLDSKTIRIFGLGYSGDAWDNLAKHLLGMGYSEEDLLKAGLVTEKKSKDGIRDRFVNRVMFPIFDHTGNVIGFGGRVLDNSLPKYLNSPETVTFSKSKNLYAINFAKKSIASREIPLIIVEGYMDVIALHQYGIKNAVAPLGTALTADQAGLVKRFTDKVIIAFDSDEAGVAATLRGIDILSSKGIDVKVLDLAGSKDPDDFIRKNGADSFHKAIETAMPFVQFKIDEIKRANDIETDEGKINFCKEVSKILKDLDSPVEVEHYLKKVSSETGISVSALGKQVYGKYFSTKQFNVVAVEKAKTSDRLDTIKDGLDIAEKKLLCIAAQKESLKAEIIAKLEVEDFQSGLNRDIFEKIKNKIALDDIEAEAMSLGGEVSTDENELESLIRRVKKNSLKKQSERLKEIQQHLQLQLGSGYCEEKEKELLKIGMQILGIENELRKY